MGTAMTIEHVVHLVRRWFEQAEQANGPLLPDGWFGERPHDNIYFLVDVQPSDDGVMIQLTDDTMLRIDGPGRAFVENSDLVFDGFRQATLRWKHYGGGEDAPYHERTYEKGQVRLAAPIGTKVDLS
jgi:hypothetical protein